MDEKLRVIATDEDKQLGGVVLMMRSDLGKS